jgi:hypothetical protein
MSRDQRRTSCTIAAPHVRVHLIGERFAPVHDNRYLDLATGECVLLRQWPVDVATVRTWSENCANEIVRRLTSSGSLIDYGITGSKSCFEVRRSRQLDGALSAAGVDATTRFADRAVAAAVADRRGGVHVVRLPAPPGLDRREVGSLIARLLRPHGYVTVAAQADVNASILATLAHRHVVLLCFGAADRRRAVAWVRHLGLTSPRAHLVVDAADANVRKDDAVLRERVPVYGLDLDASRHLRRAGILRQRRRLAASARHLRAAMAGARRGRDPGAEVHAAAELLTLLLRRGESPAVRRVAWALAREVESEAHRIEAVWVAARALICCAEIRDAELILATVSAECALQHRSIPLDLRLCELEVAFWQGRLECAASVLDSVADKTTLEVLQWRGLIAWVTGDVAALRRSTAVLSTVESEAAARWSSAFDLLLRIGVEGQRSGIAGADELIASAGKPDGYLMLMVAEALATEQPEWRADMARLVHSHVSNRQIASPLHRLILRWISMSPEDRGAAGDLVREVQRRGAGGLLRWGVRRSSMRLSESVPRLLQLVSDADDDQHALASACAWTRDQPGVSAVTIVAAGDGRVLCGSTIDALELANDDLHALIHAPRSRVIVQSGRVTAIAPVRAAGRTIAALIARGRSEVAETLKEIVDTAAPLCAPAVRAQLDAVALAA